MKKKIVRSLGIKLPKNFPLSQEQVNFLCESIFELFKQRLLSPPMKICRLSGGKLPQRMSTGAAGYDVFARAIVSPLKGDNDPTHPQLRRKLFDFKTGPRSMRVDPQVKNYIKKADKENEPGKEWVYRLDPGESVLVDVGFATEMPPELFFWTSPRSGLASVLKVTVTNAPGTVDCDYRGSAGILMHNRGTKAILIRHHMRVAQILFSLVLTPRMTRVKSLKQLSRTERSGGGFGSTGNGLVNELKTSKKKTTKRKKQKTTA